MTMYGYGNPITDSNIDPATGLPYTYLPPPTTGPVYQPQGGTYPPPTNTPPGVTPPTTPPLDPNASGGTSQPLPTGPGFQTPVNNPNPTGPTNGLYPGDPNGYNGGYPAGAPIPPPSTGQSPSLPATQSSDPNVIRAWLQWQAGQPNTDPILDTPGGIDYYLQRITETGGLGTPNSAYWQNKMTLGSAGGAVGVPEGGSGSGSAGGLPPGSFSPITPTSSWSPDPRTNDLYNILYGIAGQNPLPSANDPIIKGQTDAFNATETRNRNTYLSNLAEREGSTANLNMEGRMSAEKAGTDEAQFQATLMSNELSARRQQIMQALSTSAGFISDQERLSLQNELAIMDNLLGQAGLQQGAYQFDQNLQARIGGF